ncbi:MAG TPA: pyridoxamine 5'-phosphate oxidase family protein, partial [Noviherbaspirillum sp.]|nr:pyridoxamine 5'-phosphate oxidase family protein [Noviherbaspirillum sp.]
MTVTLNAIRECFEGALPAIIATAADNGMPNVAYSSQVQFIDDAHVALSYQFFNKTHKNIMVNPRAMLTVIHPGTVQQYRLTLHYLHTETSGPLFESMKAKLAGIASQTGMSGVFRLLGADVFRVLGIEAVEGATLPAKPPRCNLLAALRAWSMHVAHAADLETLLADTLSHLDRQFGIRHAMLLMLDANQQRLFTVASIG